jgi:hypothetical protein
MLLAAKRTEGLGWLTEDFIEHFCACVQDVARRSALAGRARTRRAGPVPAGGGLLGRMQRGLAGIGSPVRSAVGGGGSASSSSSSSSSSAATAAAGAANNTAAGQGASSSSSSSSSAAAAAAAAARTRSEDDGDDLDSSSQASLQGLGGGLSPWPSPPSAHPCETPPLACPPPNTGSTPSARRTSPTPRAVALVQPRS